MTVPAVSPWRLCVAPMMDWTDRHCRWFHRLLAPDARLYTEMVVAQAAIHGDRERLLGFDRAEHPLALQLGGSDPALLAQAARIGVDFGYDEINLNCGCPSDRVQSGRFGACLMLEPALVGDCVAAMRAAVPQGVPVTVKCRLGVDDHDDEAFFRTFIDVVAAAGCEVFIVHARKAWLHGLSPKQNREVPPLDHRRVLRLKDDRPELTLVLNGGIRTLEDAAEALARLDGVMLGRAAYHEPYLLTGWQQALFARPPLPPTRSAVLAGMRAYIAAHLARGGELRHVGRHLLGLYQGEPGARSFRRTLSEARPGAGLDTLDRALACVEPGAMQGPRAAVPA
jgi:tRNA-dihydrouridine synthase A